MAFASDSTTAPARPLLPARAELPATIGSSDRLEMGVDHNAHYGAFLYARLGDVSEVDAINGVPERGRDMGERYDAHIRSAAKRRVELPPEPLLPAERTAPAPCEVSDLGPITAAEVTTSLLPLPAPLPSLSAALSRRRAIFGAVALAAAPVAVMPVAASALSPNDCQLVALAAAYEALDAMVNATHSEAPDYDALTEGFGRIEVEVADTPADSLVGVIAKARVCQVPTARAFAENDHILSVADDLCRLHAAGRLANV